MVVDAASLEIIREERKAKQTITDIKFASASDVVALASSDGRVYIHGTQKFELRFTVQTPMRSCCITQIDFSADASLLRLSTDLSQLFFYSLQAGDMVNNPTEVRDVQWAMGGGSVSFTWQTQGVFRRGIDSALVSAVALHPSGRFVAASYDSGDVRIYRYPSQSQQLPFLSLTGVASEACRLLFSADGLFLIVLDSKTRAVLQFRISIPKPSAPSTVAIPPQLAPMW
jgi:WD40 repeat protein